MAVCSFVENHDIYDKDIDSKVRAAVNSLAAENKAVDFLFHRMSPFMDICLRAILEAKSRFPQKITVTLVLDKSDYKRFQSQDAGSLPFCMVDKVILPPLTVPEGNDFTKIVKKTQRWLIQKSTHVICYLYRQFYKVENYLLDYAKKRPVNIIDLTDKDTEHAICEDIELLPENVKKVIGLIETGHTRKGIEALLGLSSTRIHQMITETGHTLRSNAKGRLIEELSQDKDSHPVICSIFAIENFTYEVVSSFLFTVLFLSKKYDSIRFEIEEDDDNSNALEILKLLAEFIAISNIRNYHSKDIKSIGKVISKLYQTFNTKQAAFTMNERVAEMIQHSDFCICDLTSSPIAEEIRDEAANTGKTILLDIGKAFPKVEKPLS
ncbi:MAG: hypothetical protein HFG26_09165 [Provencibacterium sp.]|jgi:hypothetical protein|nr:hypothetical protein [Provencibacterium sp.]